MYKTPTGMSVNCMAVWRPNIVTSPVIGITANAIKQVVALIIGAKTKTTLSAAEGIMSSFSANLTPSANAWIKPNGPTRFGPGRCCMRPTNRRSPQTDISVSNTQITKTINAFTTINQPGSAPMSSAVVMPSPP